jgi:uncharacterized protein (DUF2267 family)
MTKDALTNELAAEIRSLYADHPDKAEERIETLLQTRLSAHGAGEAKAVIRQVIGQFRKPHQTQATVDSQIMTRMFSLLLGRKVEPDDLSSTALLERLAESLNTIFNALNQLISVINISFSGGVQSGDQTIRQFIGFHLGGEDQTKSLEDYLGQINQAFLMTHEAFKKAAQSKVRQILHAIDPAKVATERSAGLKLGPLRKAEDFDNLKTKIERIQKWFDSGRFMEDFLREFESNCQQFDRKDRR